MYVHISHGYIPTSEFVSSKAMHIFRSSCCGTAETNPTSYHEVAGSILGLAQWVNDPALLWLWCRLAATAPILPLAWEPPYAMGEAIESQKKKKLCIFSALVDTVKQLNKVTVHCSSTGCSSLANTWYFLCFILAFPVVYNGISPWF